MKATLYTINGKKKGNAIELPTVFQTPLRPDVIKRAVLAEQSWKRQPKGVSPLAGRLVAVENWGPGRGAARVPRMKGSRTHSAQRAAFIPMARGGHKAHPPRAEKIIIEKINRKEHKLALGPTHEEVITMLVRRYVQSYRDLPLLLYPVSYTHLTLPTKA